MTWRKWPGANFSPGPRRDVSGHGSSVRPNEFNFIHIFLFVFHAHITIFLWAYKTQKVQAQWSNFSLNFFYVCYFTAWPSTK